MSKPESPPEQSTEQRSDDFVDQLLGIIPRLLEDTGSVLIPGIGSWNVRKQDDRVVVGFKPHAKLKNNIMNRMKKSASRTRRADEGGFIPSEALAMHRRRPRSDIDIYEVFEEVVAELGLETASDGRLKVTWQGSRSVELKKPVIELPRDDEIATKEREETAPQTDNGTGVNVPLEGTRPLAFEPEIFEPEMESDSTTHPHDAEHVDEVERHDAAIEITEPVAETEEKPNKVNPETADTDKIVVSTLTPDSLLQDRELWKVPPATAPLVPDFSLEKNTGEADISPTIDSKPETTTHDDDTNEYRKKREQFYSPPGERSVGLIILVILVTLGLIATVVYSLYIHGDLNAWLPPEWQYAPRLPSYLQRVTEMLMFPFFFRITKSSTTIHTRSNT